MMPFRIGDTDTYEHLTLTLILQVVIAWHGIVACRVWKC